MMSCRFIRHDTPHPGGILSEYYLKLLGLIVTSDSTQWGRSQGDKKWSTNRASSLNNIPQMPTTATSTTNKHRHFDITAVLVTPPHEIFEFMKTNFGRTERIGNFAGVPGNYRSNQEKC